MGSIVNICHRDNYKYRIDDCKYSFVDIDKTLWHTKLWNYQGNEALSTYRQFKTELGLEVYVMLNIPWYVQ